MKRAATHDLAAIQLAVRTRRYRITRVARDGAAELRLDEADIRACIAALDEGDFYKSMESDQRPGVWQDVYRPRYLGRNLYVKLQVDPPSGVAIVSFKKDQSR